MGPLLGLLNAEGKTIDDSPISPKNLTRLLKLIDDGVISNKIAKTVFDKMAASGQNPERIVKDEGLVQMTDASQIEAVIDKVIAAHPEEVEAFRNGKTKLLGFFVGQVMRETKGKANPQVVNEVLRQKLG
jgi:aspartyl-tRNA(Asn)/glutamyl-tRNA(Gln) amidotransferase subunit B